MRRNRWILVVFRAALLFTFGCAGEGAVPQESQQGFCQAAPAEVESRIDLLLQQMTLPEKIEQMHGAITGAIEE
jgi:hypothetical protein